MTDRNEEPVPLHQLLSQFLASEPSSIQPKGLVYGLGTMQSLNQRLANQTLPNFINAVFRGIGQVIFVNNPISGLLFLIAMLIQLPWLGVMSMIGTVSATITAMITTANPGEIQNGIFGMNGMLVGATMAFWGVLANVTWNPIWAITTIILAAFTSVVMQTVGFWFAVRFRVAPLGIPFNGVMLAFLLLGELIPKSIFDVASPTVFSPSTLDQLRLLQSLPLGFGQVFFSDKLISVVFVILGVAICTPIGAFVGLLGCGAFMLAGTLLSTSPEQLYQGLWSYNGVLTATAVGGVFYTPTLLSVSLGLFCAFIASVFSLIVAPVFSLFHLPILSLPFAMVTVGCCLIFQRSLPSLVPVVLHTVASPEEHRHRYFAAKDVIRSFRKQLRATLSGQKRNILFEEASHSTKFQLHGIFDAIDRNLSGSLSIHEMKWHLQRSGTPFSEGQLAYLFHCMDFDQSSAIDFEEFGELILRHRRLMARYRDFVTYFLPIDANEDNHISTKEMNAVLTSLKETPLTQAEVQFLEQQTGRQPLTWNRFIELLLLI